MTTDFIPDKAYLIKDKSIEQVKKEAMESLEKLFYKVTEYEDDSFSALGYHMLNNIFIEFKFYPHNKGTIIAFSKKSHVSDILGYYSPDKFIADELKKDLVRHARGREKLLWPTIKKNLIFIMLFGTLFFLPLSFLYISGHFQFYQFFFLAVCPMFIMGYGSIFLLKLKIQNLSNFPEYRVDEYTGKIELD